MRRGRLTKALIVLSVTMNILAIGLGGYFVYKKGGVEYLTYKASDVLDASAETLYPPNYLDKVGQFEEIGESSPNVLLGDSMIANANWSELLNEDISNRGISSDTIDGVMDRLDSAVYSKTQNVYIMIGINNLQNGESEESLENKYKKLVKEIKDISPDAQITFFSLLPINKDLFLENLRFINVEDVNKEVIKVNEMLEELAASEGFKFIDMYDSFTSDSQLDKSFTNDGIHLNVDGYKVWSKHLK